MDRATFKSALEKARGVLKDPFNNIPSNFLKTIATLI